MNRVSDPMAVRQPLFPHAASVRRGRVAARSCLGGLFALSLLSQALAQTNLPSSQTVASGSATVNTTGQDMVIKQTTDKVVLNWMSFGIGAQNSVTFDQPSAQSAALNRVTGNTLSSIEGSLKSNGRVFLVNPNGVVFGAGAQVNVGSLVASSLDISDTNFNSNKFQFTGAGSGEVRNEGTIQAATPGNDAYVALISKTVTNNGVLRAGDAGTVALGAGSDVTLNFGGPIRMTIDAGVADAMITNTGSAYAGGGMVVFSALGESQAKAAVINQSGIVSAENLRQGLGGQILLTASGQITTSGTLNASGAAGGGRIDVQGQTLHVNGAWEASGSGGQGGQVRLKAKDAISFSDATAITANGGSGNGGTVAIASDGGLTLRGGIKVLGSGDGQGGRVELKADGLIIGSDPSNQVLNSQVGAWLDQGAQVRISTVGDLALGAGIGSKGGQGSLLLKSGGNMAIDASIAGGNADIQLVANAQDLKSGTSVGSLTMKDGTSLTTQGKVNITMDGTAANAGVITLGNIHAADLSVESARFAGSLAVDGKTYDGTKTATAKNHAVDGLTFNSSNLTLGADLAFADKNAGTGKQVTGTMTLRGFDTAAPARDAALTKSGAVVGVTGQADVAKRALTLGQLAATDKTYDGTTAASATAGTDNRLAGDEVRISLDAAFADKNAGVGKVVAVNKVTLGGADGDNYVVDVPGLSATTATINKRVLQLNGLTAFDKTYDGNANARVIFGNNDHLYGDDLHVAASGSFDSKHAGASKTVSVTDVKLTGTDAGNYQVVDAVGRISNAGIAKRVLTLSKLKATDRVYDGTRQAVVSFGKDDRVAGDDVKVSSSSSFDSKHVGNGKTIVVNSVSLAGADGANYQVDVTGLATTASISKRLLTLQEVAALDKVYDGNRTAGVTARRDDRIAGDDLRVSVTAAFDNKNAGNGKVVDVTGMTLDGVDAGNYDVSHVSFSGVKTNASIAKRVLVLSAFRADDKTYDGNGVATVYFDRNDRVIGDDVKVSAKGNFDNKNAGSGKRVSVSGVELGGADKDNYVADYEGASTTASIARRLLTLNDLKAQNKVYDGNRDASLAFGSDDRVQNDDVRASAVGSFDNKNAGRDKVVTVTGVSLSGTDANNYVVDGTGTTTTATIDQRLLTLNDLKAQDKVYDRTTHASVAAGGDDRVKGDQMQVSLTGEFDNRNAGRDKTVAVTGISLSGDDAANYFVADTPLKTQAAITPRTLQVGITASDKVYDGRTDATISFQDDRLGDDQFQLVGGDSHFVDANAGKGKVVTAANWQLAGEDAGNYVLNAPSWQATATITPRKLAATGPSSINFDKFLRPGDVPFGTDALAGDVVKVVAGTATWGPAPGLPRAVTLADLRIEGAQAGNYFLAPTFQTVTATVTTPLPLPGNGAVSICGAAGLAGCGADGIAVASAAAVAPFGWLGEMRTLQSPALDSLWVRGLGIQVPTERLQEEER